MPHLPHLGPRWGMGGLLPRPGTQDGARWGICQHCALNRIIEGQGLLGVHEVPHANFSTTMASKKIVAVQIFDRRT